MIKALLCSAALLTLTACGGDKPTKRGKVDMKTPVSVERGTAPVKLGEILRPAPTENGDVNIVQIKPNRSCILPRAGSTSKVVNITASGGGSKRNSPLFFGQFHKKHVSGIPGYVYSNPSISDVVITDTSQPIYLALASQEATLWVIHTAPGVTIDGIAVVSGEQSAVTGTNISRNRIGFVLEHSSRRCWTPPARRANSDDKQYKDWLTWYGQKIYNPIDLDLGGTYVHASLIGPKPASPIEYKPYAGTVYASQVYYEVTFWGTEEQMQEKYPKKTIRR